MSGRGGLEGYGWGAYVVNLPGMGGLLIDREVGGNCAADGEVLSGGWGYAVGICEEVSVDGGLVVCLG